MVSKNWQQSLIKIIFLFKSYKTYSTTDSRYLLTSSLRCGWVDPLMCTIRRFFRAFQNKTQLKWMHHTCWVCHLVLPKSSVIRHRLLCVTSLGRQFPVDRHVIQPLYGYTAHVACYRNVINYVRWLCDWPALVREKQDSDLLAIDAKHMSKKDSHLSATTTIISH